jgi:endonuclease
MALYSKPVRVLMKEMAGALAKAPDAVFTKQDAISWFAEKYPKIKVGTVTAHLTRLSTNARSRTHYSAKPGEDDVLYQIDGSHYRHYRPGQDPAPIYPGHAAAEPTKVPEGEDEEAIADPSIGGEFAYETDLRNYLAKNLNKLEPGLRVYEEEGITGIEFPVGGRFIDILATDAKGGLVVIELKVSRGYDRVVGQLMRYVAWIKKNLAEPNQGVRGLIVAREISEDLLLACSMVPDVELFEYELSLSLKRVDETRV